jgi:hypothetical protein
MYTASRGKGVNAKIIEALKSGAFFRMYSK